ncbi:hypothetical protein PEV8663_04786 [Pelagimonas varians]|uniref:Uncharacterized protein n=1 Tax=Pelagimonas varians TaxID=696760 RepID=A0A238L7C3_9RHOB|nr:hypothetical protein PEV8663_04786 [Pelagimonas varians]
MGLVGGVGFGAGCGLRRDFAVGHADGARLAVQFKEDLHFAFVIRLAQCLHADFQRFAGIDFRCDLLSGLHPVKEGLRWQCPHRTIAAMAAHIIKEDLGIHQVSVQILVIDGFAFQQARQFGSGGFDINRFGVQSGTIGESGFVLEDLFLDLGRPSAGRLAKAALHHINHRFRKADINIGVFDLRAVQPLRHHHQRHVTHHLGRWRDLDDIAKHPVHIGIGLRHFVPALLKPHRARLRLEIGELAAGHFMQIHLGRRGLLAAFERSILPAHRLEVVRDVADRADVQTGVAIGVAQRLDHRPQSRLRCVAREAVHRCIHHVNARIGRRNDCGDLCAGCVMGVEMDRQTDLFFQRFDQRPCGRGLEQARHILEPQNMRPCGLQLLPHGNVVFQVIFGAVRIQNIAGIANCALKHPAGIQHRIHRHAHVFHPVQAVKHPEHINAGFRGLFDKELHHIVRIIGVAHAIGTAQQHLRHHIGHGFAQIAQALPRAFLQEPVGHIKGRPAPTFDAEQLRQVVGISGRCADHIHRPHPCRQQRLVPVAHGGVGDQQMGLRRQPIGHGLRALGLQQGFGAVTRRGGQQFRHTGRFEIRGGFGTAFDLGMPVHRDIGDIGQHLGAAIPALFELEQLWGLVDEFGGVLVVQKHRMFEQVFHKGDVGRHAAHAEFAQGAVHAGNRLFRRRGPGGDLGQQAVVIARDHAARISGAAVQTNAHAGGAAIGGDAAIIGDKVVLRVFGCHPRLQRVAVQTDVVLRRFASGFGQ